MSKILTAQIKTKQKLMLLESLRQRLKAEKIKSSSSTDSSKHIYEGNSTFFTETKSLLVHE